MPFSTFQRDDIRWYGDESKIAELFSFSPVVVKDNKQRLITSHGLEKPEFYLKQDKSWGFRNRFKRLFRDRIRNEFESGVMLQDAGISVVEHLGWGRRGKFSYLATRAFSGETFDVFHEKNRADSEKMERVIRGLVVFLKTFLQKSFYHPDLHAGNILVSEKDGDFEFCLVDVYGVRQEALSPQKINEVLVFLLSNISDWPEGEKLKIFSEFASVYGNLSGKEILGQVFLALFKRLDKYRRTRVSKYLRNSSLCNAWLSSSYGKVVAQKKHPREKVETILSKFVSGDCEAIKNAEKRRVARVRLGEKSFIVKQFLRPRWYFGRWRYDCCSWLNGIALENMGIPVAEHLAWARNRETGLLIMEDVGKANLVCQLISSKDRGEQLRLLRKVLRIIFKMHGYGLFHNDLKISNFVVGAGEEVTLIDNDDISYAKKVPVPKTRCQKNLVPLTKYLLHLQKKSYVDLPGKIDGNLTSEKNLAFFQELLTDTSQS